jgi:beta-galactosidase
VSRILKRFIFSVSVLLSFNFLLANPKVESKRHKINFNTEWRFFRGALDVETVYKNNFDHDSWKIVHLPHAPEMTPMRHAWPLINSSDFNWYRKEFKLSRDYKGRKLFLEFEGADQVTDVWVNEKKLVSHSGAFTPFFVDITKVSKFGSNSNVLCVRVNNKPNQDIPVYGSWISFGGLYRDVFLHITDQLHITDAVHANKIGGGGIFVTYPFVSDSLAEVKIKTDVLNEDNINKSCQLKSYILNAERQVVASVFTEQHLDAEEDHTFIQTLKLKNPLLWHPNHPNLYTLVSEVYDNNELVDVRKTRIGIRHIDFIKDKGFSINGKRMKFMGTNRVQDYPYVAWAFSNEAQKRDAILLKEAGFQYIRLSHNLHDPSFLDACDELGILVMACIPGFQFIGGEKFRSHSFLDMRDLIRRDRNHPSVIVWELSLNETDFDSSYAKTAMKIGHEEFPGNQCFVSGWKFDNIYDVFIRATQHGAREYLGETPLVISEYGHWDYGEGNSSSDVNRKDGEEAMLKQAFNHQESLNANRALPFLGGDGLWVGIDFQIYPSGVIDYFRLPKFSYYFYQSQRDPYLQFDNIDSGPMIFIANYWTENSPREVKVFSNCDSVQLQINGETIAIQSADNNSISDFLRHPPFTFKNVQRQPGEIKAIGYLNGRETVEHTQRTPGEAMTIEIEFNLKTELVADGEDLFFAHAKIVDKNGTLVAGADTWLNFEVTGPALLKSPNRVQAEAGIASALVRVTSEPGEIIIKAKTPGLNSGIKKIVSLRKKSNDD